MHLIDLDAGFLGATPVVGSDDPDRGRRRVRRPDARRGQRDRRLLRRCRDRGGRLPRGAQLRGAEAAAGASSCARTTSTPCYSPLAVRQPPERRPARHRARPTASPPWRATATTSTSSTGWPARRCGAPAPAAGRRCWSSTTYRWREHCGPNYDTRPRLPHRGRVRAWADCEARPRAPRDGT